MEVPWKHFKTLDIEHSELSENENERTLWYLSNTMMDKYEPGGIGNDGLRDILDYLNDCLIDNMDYYVFHDVKTYKGKKLVKAGKILIAKKSSILKFVEQDRDQDGYSTPIRIMPRIAPSFVLKIHEGDGISHFSNRSSNNYLVINDIRVSESEIYVGVTDAHR